MARRFYCNMKLEGKIINFLGDSITEGVGVIDKDNNRFDNILFHECKLKKVNNYGVGGTRIAHQTFPSDKPRHDLEFCGRAFDMDPNADIVIVYGGVNDYFHGDAPFGTYEDTDRTTFCGSVYWLCNFINETYPDSEHIFIAPARTEGDLCASKSERKPKTAKEQRPLKDYVDAIMTIASKCGFKTLSFYDSLGLNPNDPEIKEKYTIDGIHFNDEAHHIIAEKIKNFLLGL